MRSALFAFVIWFCAGVFAAEPVVPKVGVLLPESILARWKMRIPGPLSALGYTEGSRITYDWRSFRGSVAEARVQADDLVRGKVDLILAMTTPAAQAAMAATYTIPVVYLSGDPVAMRLAASLSRPGRNGTGISMLATELTAKRLDLLKQLLPKARKVAYLRNPSNPIMATVFGEAQNAAKALGLRLEVVDATDASEVEKALQTVAARRVDAVLVSEDLVFASDAVMAKVTGAMRKMKLPAVYPWSFFHPHGALMSYGTDYDEVTRRVVAYIDRVLKGAKPGDLAVEQISRYQLIVDLDVAQALKIRVPQEILYRADKMLP